LRRFSGAPSNPHPRDRTRTPSPPPHFGLERCCGSPDIHRHTTSRRGSASEESTYSSAYSGEDEDEDEEDDGIIWFGRRTPPCSWRTEQFRHWVEDAEPPAVIARTAEPPVRTAARTKAVRTATTTTKDSRSAPALWSRLFVLWRIRRNTTRSSSPRSVSSLSKKHPNHPVTHHRRMATAPS